MTDSIYDIKVLHPLATDDSSLSGDSSIPSSPPTFSSSIEEVTTIFVVGFPDDMQEREFQNMFMFAKGFEAASLKWHGGNDQQDFLLSNNNKKQMIGFARFKTRQEAKAAAKEMNGKKVDVEKGSILKAEMAKKNLHIKRSSLVPSSNSSNILPAAVPLPEPIISPTTTRRMSQQPDISFSPPQPEGFSPLPSDLLSPGDYKIDPFFIAPDTPTVDDSLFKPRQSIDIAVNPFHLFSKSFHSEYETDPFSYLSKSSPAFNKHHPFNIKKSDDSNCDYSAALRKNSLQPHHHSERSASISLSHTTTDQNPPCNTLYVGNLPAASNEDELRSLFSTCEGYKRMSFRQKPQGPMCFVEFEDVVFATQAMNQLQGHALSNSVRGGIRLSFSKNPLFIKPSKETEISLGFKQLGTALLADV